MIAKATGEREGQELQIQFLKAFYIPLGKPKHYLAQSKGADMVMSEAQDPAEYLGQHEKTGYLSCVVTLCQLEEVVFYTAILPKTSFTLRKEPMQQLSTKCLQACRNP